MIVCEVSCRSLDSFVYLLLFKRRSISFCNGNKDKTVIGQSGVYTEVVPEVPDLTEKISNNLVKSNFVSIDSLLLDDTLLGCSIASRPCL